MTSNFPNGPDSIVNNVGNTTPEFDIHPPLHNQLADAIMAVEVSLLAGGSLSLGDHLVAADPHPVYLTQAEADARYPQLSATDPYPVYLTQPEGDARYAPISGGGYLTQVQADARYLQLAGGTLSGNLLFSTDNLRDIGAVAATRPRTLYLGTSLVTPGWTNGTNFLANTDNTYDIGASGANRPRNLFLAGSETVGGTSTIGSLNTALLSPTGNTIEQRNGASPQSLRVYNTYTDASNYERLFVGYSGNQAYLTTQSGGTGVARPLNINGDGGVNFYVGTGRWGINTNGHLLPAANNAFDIGGSGGTAGIRHLFVGSNIYVSGAMANRTKAGVPSDGDVVSASDGMCVLDTTDNRIYFRSGGVWRYATLT